MDGAIDSGFPSVYEILKKIGRGGTADVFLARRHGHSRPVVLKRFYDPSAEFLITREMDVARRAHFPGLVRLHRVDRTSEGVPFIHMEYCDGPTLETLSGRITESKLLAVLSAVSASLYVLHQAGFVHNDVKPSNIFCPAGFDRDDFPIDRLFYLKLADFSLAGPIDGGQPAATGTIGYMSPEMILKKDVSGRSDFFSLGAMAYQLACGRMPFTSESDDPLEINAQITEGERPSLTGPGSSFSAGIGDLIRSLLEIDPARRPPSAFALMQMLAKLGSPYPFRTAVRPKHLINGLDAIDGTVLTRIFGPNSFTIDQTDFIRRTTGFDRAGVRMILEHNFDRGNFAPEDGGWGWPRETDDAIEWSERQTRFSLRPLHGTAVSVKKLALALAVLGPEGDAEKTVTAVTGDAEKALATWTAIPGLCRPALIYALAQRMHPATRKILAGRLVRLFCDREECAALTGRLMFSAGQYHDAIDYLITGAEQTKRDARHNEALDLLAMALDAAGKTGDPSRQAKICILLGRFQKEFGRLPESEKTFLEAVDLIQGGGFDEILAQIYKELGDLYRAKTDYRSGIDVLTRALDLYTRLNDQLGLSHTLNNLGNMYWIAGNLDAALEHNQKALEIQRGLECHKEIATSLNNIGSICLVKGDYPNAIAHYTQSLEMREQLGEGAPVAQSWNNLGATHFLMGNVGKAIDAFARSLALNRSAGSKLEELLNLENLAEAMIQAGRLSEALVYLKEGTGAADKLGEASHQSTIARLTGQLLRRMGHYDDAEAELKRSVELARQAGSNALELLSWVDLARLFGALGETDAAAGAAQTARKMADEIGDKNALFHIALLDFARTGDDQYKHMAEVLVNELNTERERALLHVCLLEHPNRIGITADSRTHVERAGRFFSEQTEDIDLARNYLAIGIYSRLNGDIPRSLETAQQAMAVAGKLNLLPEQLHAACLLSELMFEQKEYEISFRHARRATEILKKISSHVKDTSRLGRFHRQNDIVNLLGRIKSLQAILSKSKGAAIGSP